MAVLMPPPSKRLRTKTKPTQSPQATPPDLSPEIPTARQHVYLVTFSHPQQTRSACGVVLKAPNAFQREAFLNALLDAFAHPVYVGLGPSAAHAGRTVVVEKISIFKECHKASAGGIVNSHYHAPVKGTNKFSFMPIKRALLQRHGMATHWSTSHTEYRSAVRYCFIPSPRKPQAALDSAYLLWPRNTHPPLMDVIQEPITAKALQARREKLVLAAAEDARQEPRPHEIDVWPLIVRFNIRNTDDNREAHLQLIEKAKEVCSPTFFQFLFRIRHRLPKLIDDVWQWEEVTDRARHSGQSRMEALQTSMSVPCTCGGLWRPWVEQALRVNGIDMAGIAHDLYANFAKGRSETVPVVVLAGLHGGEGKNLLLSPITAVLGMDYVMQGVATGQFPLVDLPSKKAVLLNEWRFTCAPISLGTQLLWLEGKPVPVARPQNDRDGSIGHCLYRGTAPIFIISPLEHLQPLIDKAEEDLAQGRASQLTMLMRRLHIYKFTQATAPPQRYLHSCAACFATFLLEGEAAWCQNNP